MSWIIVALAAVSSVAGLAVPGMYRGAMWQGYGLGNDLVTLVAAVPALAAATLRAARGSGRGYLLWLGALCYMAYNYVFYLFGAPVNQLFAPYAASFTLSLLALVFALARGNAEEIGRAFRTRTPARWVAVNMLLFAGLVGASWLMPWAKYVVTGEIPQVNGDPDTYRFIAAGDLAFLVSPFVLAALWLWQRRPWGFVLATAVSVQFGMYALVLIATCLMAVRAGDAGALSMLPVWIGLGVSAWLSLAGLLPNAPSVLRSDVLD